MQGYNCLSLSWCVRTCDCYYRPCTILSIRLFFSTPPKGLLTSDFREKSRKTQQVPVGFTNGRYACKKVRLNYHNSGNDFWDHLAKKAFWNILDDLSFVPEYLRGKPKWRKTIYVSLS